MNTDQLINVMAADNVRRRSYLHSFVLGAGIGIAADALLFFIAVGPRSDFAAAVETWRYLFKFVVTISLAVPAVILTYQLAAPAMWDRCRFRILALPLAMLAAAAIVELDLLPPSLWMTRMVGSNSVNCVILIPVLAVIPLISLLSLLRHGAPCNGGLAGSVAGLAAGAISATFYALNCFDDSPLFVIVWYPLAAAIVVMAGSLLGRRFLVW